MLEKRPELKSCKWKLATSQVIAIVLVLGFLHWDLRVRFYLDRRLNHLKKEKENKETLCLNNMFMFGAKLILETNVN